MMFRYNLSVLPSKIKKSKRENVARLKLTDTVFFFWDYCPLSKFLNKHEISEVSCVSG